MNRLIYYRERVVGITILGLLIFGLVGIVYFNHLRPIVLSKLRQSCRNCNVVIIDIDSLRADALPCFGNSHNTTPNICKLVENSVTFEQNFTTSWWTLPSMFSTFTSLYPLAHGVNFEFVDSLSPNVKTMAEILKEQGYKTVFVGGQHESRAHQGNGGMRGFDSVFNGEDPGDWNDKLLDTANQSQPSFIFFYSGLLHMPYLLNHSVDEVNDLQKIEGIPTTIPEFNQVMENFLKNNYKQIFYSNIILENPQIFSKKPIDQLALLNFFNSVVVRDDAYRYVRDRFRPIQDAYLEKVSEAMSKGYSREQVVSYIYGLYGLKLSELDAKLFDLFEQINKPEFSSSTIVIFISDHGEEFMERGNWGHGPSLYNEILHTPMIVRIPGIDQKRVLTVTQNLDVLPSLIDILDIDTNKSIRYPLQGKSLIDAMLSNRKPIFWFPARQKNIRTEAFSTSNGREKLAIQDGRWKLILSLDSEPTITELYDLSTDGGEKINVAKYNSDIVTKYLGVIKKMLDDSSDYPKSIKRSIDELMTKDKIEKMKKEGYF